MDALDFRKDFLENVKLGAVQSGDGSCAAFVEEMAHYLEQAEVLPEFYPAFYTNTAPNRKKYRVDGYALDEFDHSLILIIASFSGGEEKTFIKSEADKLFQRLSVFLDQALNGLLHEEIEDSTPCSDLVDLIRERKGWTRKYKFLLFTDSIKSSSIKGFGNIDVSGVPAECHLWDIERLFWVCTSNTGRQNIHINFKEYTNEGIPCLEASSASTNEYNSYLCIIPGKVLADVYDKYGSLLLEGNVRSFLSTKVAVNKKIRETIIQYPNMFFAYNNGVSATALDVEIENHEGGRFLVGARDFQIINGGQTTASLSNTRHKDKADLSNIYVQMKLTEIGEMDQDSSTELIRNISRSSNSQNKVSDADFFATHPFHVRMEQFSRRLYAQGEAGSQYDIKWFYERARGQYLQAQMRMTASEKEKFLLQNPKNKVITKTDLAKVRNTWLCLPHEVSKGAQTNFMRFASLIDDSWSADDQNFNERYYTESVALIILFKHLEMLIPKQSWYEQGYRANIITYSIALLKYLIDKKFKGMELDLQGIWKRQRVPSVLTEVLEIITPKVFFAITADDRPTVNVTQWCKRESCWKKVQGIDIQFPEEFITVLLDKEEANKAKKEAKSDQKILTGLDAQRQVLRYSASQWQEVAKFFSRKNLMTRDVEKAIEYACSIPKKVPSPYQSQQLLALLEKALGEGFKF